MNRPSVSNKSSPTSPSSPLSPPYPPQPQFTTPTHLHKHNANSNSNSNGDNTTYDLARLAGRAGTRQEFQLKLEDDDGGRDEDSETEGLELELTPLAPSLSLARLQSQLNSNGEVGQGEKLSETDDKRFEDAGSEDEDWSEKYSYGWSNFRPKSLQFMSNRNAFLVVFCLTCILQGTFHTYFVAVITTLEKLFSIPSRTTGMIMSATEIGQVSSSLLLPYYVSTRHRPHWISYGSILFSIATLLTVTPHLLYPPRMPKSSSVSDNLCIKKQSPYFPEDANLNSSFFHENFTHHTTSFLDNGSYIGNFTMTSNSHCEDDRDPPPYFLFGILFMCLLCIGLGQTAVYTLGIPYLDDNVASRDSPLYFSITIGVRILGPVFGFILGSFCTRLFIYPWKEPKGMTPSNPQWLGAWWLGMILISTLLLINSILIYGFPQSLQVRKDSIKGSVTTAKTASKTKTKKQEKNSKKNGKKEIAQLNSTTTTPLSPMTPTTSPIIAESDSTALTTPLNKSSSPVTVRNSENPHPGAGGGGGAPLPPPPKLSNFPMTLKRLFNNRILMLRTCSSVLHLLPISGLYTFLPKYLESQFRLAAFEANIYTGIAGILVMGIGIFSSGVYIRKKEPDAKTVAFWVATSAIIYAAGMGALMFTGCDQQDFNIGQLSSPTCKTEHCTSCADIYSPVCADNQTYLSICHAGCHTYNDTTQEYECDCVSSPPTPGLCPSTCNLFYLYTAIFIVIVLVHSSSEVGSMLLTLRCVHPSDKAMALGLVQCAIGLLGNVPCPIIYGSIVDSTCTIWGTDCRDASSRTGHCWLYDSNKFRIYFNGTTSFFMFLASLFDIAIYFKAKDIQITTPN